MAQGSFSATINSWVAETKERKDLVFQEAAELLLAEVVRPGPSVANPGGSGGGNMPIDTGFLAASLQVRIGDGLAVLVGNPGETGKTYSYDAAATTLVINGAKFGDTITASFAAEYAIVMEARYAFVALAAQRWQQFVDTASQTAEASVRSRS